MHTDKHLYNMHIQLGILLELAIALCNHHTCAGNFIVLQKFPDAAKSAPVAFRIAKALVGLGALAAMSASDICHDL